MMITASDNSLKLLSATLLMLITFFLTGATGQQCGLSSVVVQTTNVGPQVGLDTTFEVEVKNMCRCTVTNVKLSVLGFASSTMVDPKLFRPDGDRYLINDDNGIASSSSVKFYYSWDHFFKMTTAGFQVAC